MGEGKDYDNRDFSDLSDANQEHLNNTSSNWNSASAVRGDDGYNPHSLENSENSAISKSKNLTDNPLSQESVPSFKNNVMGGTHKSRNSAQGGKLKSFFKSKGAMFTAGGVVVGGSGLAGLISFMTVGLMPIHVQEIITEKMNSAASSMEMRTDKVYKAKVKGINCKTGFFCRLSKASDRNIKNLEKAGFLVEYDEKRNLFGKKTITKLTHKETGEVINNNTKDLKRIMRTRPELRASIKQGFSGRFASFLDKVWNKIKNLFQFKKVKADNKGKDEQQLQEEANETANSQSKDTQKKSSSMDTEIDEVDENGNTKTKKTKKDRTDADKGSDLAEKELKNLGKEQKGKKASSKFNSKGFSSKLNTALKGIGAAAIVCGLYTFGNIMYTALKSTKLQILIQFSLTFLSFASKIKAGHATPQEASMVGNSLMDIASTSGNGYDKDKDNKDNKDKKESTLFRALKYLADSSTKKDSVAATDSQGYKAIAYGDQIQSLNESAEPFSVGVIKDFIGGFLNAIYGDGIIIPYLNIPLSSLLKSFCAIVTSVAVGVVVAAATIAATCIGTAGIGCAVTVALNILKSFILGLVVGMIVKYFIGDLIDKWVGQAASVLVGDLVNKTTIGEDYGNAVMSGAGAGMAKNTLAGGGNILSTSEATEFAMENEKIIAEHAEDERRFRSPFDPTTRHTFLGSIVSSIIPYNRQLATVGGFIPAIMSTAGRSINNIIPTAQAANESASIAANSKVCTDTTITKTGATDIFCNVYTGINVGLKDKNSDEVVKWLEDNNYLDSQKEADKDDFNAYIANNEKGEKFKKYIKWCYDRKVPIGIDADEEEPEYEDHKWEKGRGCNTEEEYKKYFALFLTDVRINQGMEEGVSPSGNNGSSSGSGGGVDPDLAALSGEFVWPLKGVKMNGKSINGVNDEQDFGPRSHDGIHYGIDFGSAGFGHRAPVYAAGDGKVVEDGYNNGYWGQGGGGSHVVVIEHKGGIFSLYFHMSDHIVKTGDSVSKGQRIGTMGEEGNAFGEHLHFQMHKNSKDSQETNAFDPTDLIKGDT